MSSFALKIFDGRLRAAVKAPDELATLGLDCRPRRLKSLALRAKEDYEDLSRSRRTENYNQNHASANVRKSLDTTLQPEPCLSKCAKKSEHYLSILEGVGWIAELVWRRPRLRFLLLDFGFENLFYEILKPSVLRFSKRNKLRIGELTF